MMFDSIYSFWVAMTIVWALGAALMHYCCKRFIGGKKYNGYAMLVDTEAQIFLWASILWPVTLTVALVIQFFRAVTYFEGPR